MYHVITLSVQEVSGEEQTEKKANVCVFLPYPTCGIVYTKSLLSRMVVIETNYAEEYLSVPLPKKNGLVTKFVQSVCDCIDMCLLLAEVCLIHPRVSSLFTQVWTY